MRLRRMSLRTYSPIPRSAAAAFCGALIIWFFYSGHGRSEAFAAADEAWQGQITITDTAEAQKEESEEVYGAVRRHVFRDRRRSTATYTGFNLAAENDEERSWIGAASVNLVLSANHYTFDSEKSEKTYSEQGYDTTTNGATVAQGEVKFYRYPDQDDPRKTKCRIEVDAQEDWRDREELKVWENGRSWSKFLPPPESTNSVWDKAVHEPHILAPVFVGVDFECDPKSASYSGEQRIRMNADGTSMRVVSWSLRRGAVPQTEVELIPPQPYDRWLPEAGENEKTLGNYFDVGIVAHKKGDASKAPPDRILKYTITLEGTSKEKGVDLNWPGSGATDDYDLQLDKDNPWIKVKDETGQSAETKEPDLREFSVTVNSYDWGAYGKLKVVAELEGGGMVVGHVRGHPDQELMPIPKDDNSNHIADYWEHWFALKNTSEDADEDDTPQGDGDTGDSIALYDEYRGFHMQGKHDRLSPEIKDLFVFDQSGLGAGIYSDVTRVSVHMINFDERSPRGSGNNNNVITPNGTHGDVWAIWVHDEALADGGVGETPGGPGVPRDIVGVAINSTLITAAYGAQASAELQSTIAHELGHATNVWHHGEAPPDYDIGDARCRRPDGSVRNFMCSSTPKGKVGTAAGGCYEVAGKGGKYSGNDSCIMRYDLTNFYEDPGGNCQWQSGGRTVIGSLYGQDPPGMSMCDNPKGTGVNDTSNPHNKAGNASPGRGNCIHKFCLNNRKH